MHFDPFKMRTEFNIPDEIEPVALLVMGYPADDAEPMHLHYEYRGENEIVVYENF
jgi:nitroreductase